MRLNAYKERYNRDAIASLIVDMRFLKEKERLRALLLLQDAIAFSQALLYSATYVLSTPFCNFFQKIFQKFKIWLNNAVFRQRKSFFEKSY